LIGTVAKKDNAKKQVKRKKNDIKKFKPENLQRDGKESCPRQLLDKKHHISLA